MATTNTAGTLTASYLYDPFGNMVAAGNRPANTADGSYGYGGSAQRMTETNFALAPIQMGARVYLPTIGRFTSLDPIPGGTANNYVYVLDPINGSDYSGTSMSLTLPVLRGISISGTLQQTVSGSSLQRAVNVVQVTVNSSRIQGSAAKATSRTTISIKAVAVVKIAPKAMPLADPAKIAMQAGKALPARPQEAAGTSWAARLYNGANAANSYYSAGKNIGVIGGCVAGIALTWEAGGFGCFVVAPLAGFAVGGFFAGFGFVQGFAGTPIANSFDGWEDSTRGFYP